MTKTAIALVVLAGLALAPRVASAAGPSFTLDEVAFTADAAWADADRDHLRDAVEFQLADHFKPFIRFDSSEGARRGDEPVTLFQARPIGCIGGGTMNGSNCGAPWRIQIKYALLFQRDGGYGPSSDCGDSHNGDNEDAALVLVSYDARTWSIESFTTGIFGPTLNVGWYQESHPIMFMSGHKHHTYLNTAYDGSDSPYSNWGCNDDVNGLGPQILPTLVAPDGRYANVGEPESHPAPFINDLAMYAYPGENAWSWASFGGGLERSSETSSLAAMWMRTPLQLGAEIRKFGLRYDAVFNPLGVPEYVMTGWRYGDFTSFYWNTAYNQGFRIYSIKNHIFNGEFLYDVVLRPSSEPSEIWVAGWSHADFDSYNQYLFSQGWRLYSLQTVVMGGALHHTAVWHPGGGAEWWMAGIDYNTFWNQANSMFNQGYRLDSYQTYALNGQLAVTAVWHPGQNGEYWVAGWSEADFKAEDTYFRSFGWGLKTFNTFYLNGQLLYSGLWQPGYAAQAWGATDYATFNTTFQNNHLPGGTMVVQSLSSPN